jgi:hypothetical protein
MNTERVPNLDWPTDLFRGNWPAKVIEDPDNPFWEASDFAPATEPATVGGRVPSRAFAMAE